MFSKNELNVMAKLLSLASERFSNDTCNDFKLPATPENLLLVKLADTEDQPNVRDSSIIAYDWMLMDYFRKRCEEEARHGVMGNR